MKPTLSPTWQSIKVPQIFACDREILHHSRRLKHPAKRVRDGARKSLAYYRRMKDIVIKLETT